MRLHEFIKDADDQEVTELIGAVARGIGGAVKGAAKLGVGAAKLGYKGAAGLAGVMDPNVGAAMKGKGPVAGGSAVANALAKTEKDPAEKAAERKELADKIQELEAQVRELRKAQTEV
jgi:carbon monoxide dehydrogenase subunit G|tara:strand:- start:2056 stop:2409 length:354 start_codon:yes stop_codon:yes gene_type:complete